MEASAIVTALRVFCKLGHFPAHPYPWITSLASQSKQGVVFLPINASCSCLAREVSVPRSWELTV